MSTGGGPRAGVLDRQPGAAPFAIGSDVWPGLAKLAEEAAEVQQIVAKLIATGGQEVHYDGSDLAARLTEEIADLWAAVEFVRRHNFGRLGDVQARARDKLRLFEQWHADQSAARSA